MGKVPNSSNKFGDDEFELIDSEEVMPRNGKNGVNSAKAKT